MFSVRRVAMVGFVGLVAAWSVAGFAQQVYRIIGPDGRVTFSDRPPDNAAKPASAPAAASTAAARPGTGQLPFELRTVATRYPVTLYTGNECGPCASARSYLRSRGIPHSERTVVTEDDVEALKRLAGAPRLPVVTIGGQQLRGFSEVEWGQYLDAAGYPGSSQLPSGYRFADATPLVAAQPAQRPGPAGAAGGEAAASTDGRSPPVADTSTPAPPNPAGIRF